MVGFKHCTVVIEDKIKILDKNLKLKRLKYLFCPNFRQVFSNKS